MERWRRHNEDGVISMKVDEEIGNVGRGCGISMTGPRNVEANGESMRPFGIAGRTPAEGAGTPRDVECRRRHRRGRREGYRPLNASISDCHTERLYWQYVENGNESASEKLINCRE
jgi:hypothetical protein